MSILGSAEWGAFSGVSEDIAFNGSNLVFGKDFKDGWLATRPEKHFLTIGETRGKKGVSLIIPNLLTYRGSCIVIDPKGENAWITAKARRNMGQKIYILDPWDQVKKRFYDNIVRADFDNCLSEIKPTELSRLGLAADVVSRFNPLSILNPKNPNYTDDLAYLADALIINQGKDPHWDNSARELVAGLIAFLVESYGSKSTLSMVRALLSKPAHELINVAKRAQDLGHESIAARKLGRFVQLDAKGAPSPTDEMMSVLSTALTQTAILDSVELAASMEENDFSFDDLLSGNTTIYLVLPPDKLETCGRWLRLMVSIAIRAIALNMRRLNLPVLFMLDEFGTIGRLSIIAQAFGLMAGLNMCVWAFLQDLNQLKADYPEKWETFIANSKNITAFGLMDQFTCEYVSKLLGQTTVERISAATAEVRKRNPDYTQMADQVYQRPLAAPEDLRLLRAALLIGRHLPLQFEQVCYFENLRLLKAARPDPRYLETVKQWRALHYDVVKKPLHEERNEQLVKFKRENEKTLNTFDKAKAACEVRGFVFGSPAKLDKEKGALFFCTPWRGGDGILFIKTFYTKKEFITWAHYHVALWDEVNGYQKQVGLETQKLVEPKGFKKSFLGWIRKKTA